MDNATPRIDKAVIFGFRSLHSESMEVMRECNDYIHKTVQTYPDRFIGAVLVDASWGDRALEELNRMAKHGYKVAKIKFASYHMPANCPLALKLLKEVEDLGILPLFHSDWSHWTNPSILGELAGRFPDMKMVMQHFGLTESTEAIQVLRAHDNMYADTSAVIHPRNIKYFVETVDPDRIMYASDSIKSYERTMPQEEIDRVTGLGLSPSHLEKVMGKNAQRLLKTVGVKA